MPRHLFPVEKDAPEFQFMNSYLAASNHSHKMAHQVVAGVVGVWINTVMNSAKQVLEYGNHWYEADSAWEDFGQQVEYLEERSSRCERLIAKYGHVKDEVLEKSLFHANALLGKEVDKVKSHGGDNRRDNRRDNRFKQAAFPSLIGQSINKAIQAFDEVEKRMEGEPKLEVALQRRSLSWKPTLSFRGDTRYVQLARMENQVKEALLSDNPGANSVANCNPKIVLLYGQSGRGKSTLARHVALDVHAQVQTSKAHVFDHQASIADNQEDPSKDQHSSSANTCAVPNAQRQSRDECEIDLENAMHGQSSHSGDGMGARESSASRSSNQLYFDTVIFLECTEKSDVGSGLKQRELDEVQRELFEKLLHCAEDVGRMETMGKLKRSLKSLLRNQNPLIILDNVMDPNFLQRMINLTEPDSRVQWLVTSQDKSLCNRLTFHPQLIPMEKVQMTDAKKIFFRHIRTSTSSNVAVPDGVKKLLEELVNKVDANLLAIACLATGVAEDKIGDEKEWKEATKNSFQLLNAKNTAMIFGVEYHGSYMSAIQSSFEKLEESVRRLLVLIGLCEPSPVPQGVVEYLHAVMRGGKFIPVFRTAKSELKAKGFIEELVQDDDDDRQIYSRVDVTPDTRVSDNSDRQSIYVSVKSFLDGTQAVKKYQKSILRDLKSKFNSRGKESSAETLKVLFTVIFFYLEERFFGKIRVKSDLQSSEDLFYSKVSNMDSGARELRRNHLEPLTRVLLKNKLQFDNSKPESDWAQTREVFLHYAKDGQMSEDGEKKTQTMVKAGIPFGKAMHQFNINRKGKSSKTSKLGVVHG